jgi:hypothetical protein
MLVHENQERYYVNFIPVTVALLSYIDHYDDDGDTDDVNDDVVGDGDDDDDDARDDDETQHIKELDENRDNSDNNTAQALSGDDIETMKR